MCFCEFSFFKQVKLSFYLRWECGAKIKQVSVLGYLYRRQVRSKFRREGYIGTFESTDGIQLTAGGSLQIIPNTLGAGLWKLTFREK